MRHKSNIQDEAYSEAMDEIKRLNEVKLLLEGRIHRDYSLITELADALDHESWVSEQQCGLPSQFVDLIQKAREAVK